MATADTTPPIWQLPDTALTVQMLCAERELRQAYARVLAITSEVENRGLAASMGYRDTVVMQTETLRISGKEARRRVDHAVAITAAQGIGGSPVPAPMPATGEAVVEGAINTEHVGEIHAVLKKAPAGLEADRVAQAEETLVTLARQTGPEAVRKAGQRYLAYWDQDGKKPDDKEPAAPRQLWFSRRGRDGWLKFHGQLNPENAAVLDGMFDALAKPEPADPITKQRDPRSPAQREGDALGEIIDLAARTGELPARGGNKAALNVTVHLDQLRAGIEAAGINWLHEGSWIGLDSVRRAACDAEIIPVVLGSDGEPLDVGRAVRLATPAQRRALAIRDAGCVFPGCTRKPKWTEPHHIIAWQHHGPTDLQNLALTCKRHHIRLHQAGWNTQIRDGHAWITAPDWLDPTRTPYRNHAHDPPLAAAA